MPPWPDPGEAAITDLKTLLDAAVSGEEFAGPGLDFYPAAAPGSGASQTAATSRPS